jgi:imidazolonepropionase
MQKLLININTLHGILDSSVKALKGKDLSVVNQLNNAWLLFENDKIAAFGLMNNLPQIEDVELIDLDGKSILPAFIDSHTHLIYAANREQEFEDRLNGLTYQEVAERGGGILNSVRTLRGMSEDQLFEDASKRLKNLIQWGTGAIEIKSGYGLDLDNELKMLRVIKRLKSSFKIPIKATLLAAHAFPEEFKTNHEGYIELIVNQIIPKVVNEKLADYIDVFCEEGYFNAVQTDKILKAGKEQGLLAKIHVNQFNAIGGIEVALKNNALSVDHLEVMTENDITLLANSSCIATALPGCSFFIGIPYTPLKTLIDNNITINIASDYNPGSTPTGNMQLMMSLACIQQKLTPNQAFNACTINAAAALQLQDQMGSITVGKKANLIVTEATNLAYFPYAYGENKVNQMIIDGEFLTF